MNSKDDNPPIHLKTAGLSTNAFYAINLEHAQSKPILYCLLSFSTHHKIQDADSLFPITSGCRPPATPKSYIVNDLFAQTYNVSIWPATHFC